jgi:YggT family protein
VQTIICPLFSLYLLVLIARAILSWFPLSPGSALIPVVNFLHVLTEPVLQPFRRIIPPLGGFDLSFIVVFFLIEIVQRAICGGGGFF